MAERIEYWRGFTAGLIAGAALGVWIFFSPRVIQEVDELKELAEKESAKFSETQKAAAAIH